MADLIAIGYDDTTTAVQAMEEAERLAGDLIIEADAIAAIIRNQDGKLKTITNQHRWAVAPSLACSGACSSACCSSCRSSAWPSARGWARSWARSRNPGIDKQFQEQVREMLQPGTSALFIVFEKVTADKALDALSKFGGKVLKTSLSDDATKEINAELHGAVRLGQRESPTRRRSSNAEEEKARA